MVNSMNLLQIFSSDVKLIDLIVPLIHNESILELNRVSKAFVYLRKYVVDRKYGNEVILFLSNYSLKTISKEIGNLQNLKELRLNHNLLSSIPPEIFNLQNLEILDLSGNFLTTIPNEIENLQNLKYIFSETS